jgi:NADPH-dependent 2,4-dienoyl-CoA reductase/sulfur reductase-like enzyme
MNSAANLHFDVAVVGAGPAGIAAAVSAADSGARVALLDDNPRPGGQIWRAGPGASQKSEALRWFERLEKSSAKIFRGARVFHVEGGVLSAESSDAVLSIEYNKLILATGARELFLPFPGWTLPNVFGAGGLQALVKSGLPVKDKRVIVAGTGPLLLAVATYLRKAGGMVLAICEQTSCPRFAQFGLEMSLIPGKLREVSTMLFELGSTPLWTSCWPIAAMGSDRLTAVRLSHRGHIREMECDYLACGFHLLPNLELARLTGCRMDDGFVVVNEFQQTSVANVYCAGEPTGIGGLELALVEGQIAGLAAAQGENAARKLFRQRASYRRAVRLLKNAFRLRPELRTIAKPDTLVCRCEDVTFERLRAYDSWRAAKLLSRCGMGPCQGRVCGPAAQFLFGWEPDSTRPPVFPVRCSSLAAIAEPEEVGQLNGGFR